METILYALLYSAYSFWTPYAVYKQEVKPQEFYVEYSTGFATNSEGDIFFGDKDYTVKKIRMSYYKKDLIKKLPIRWFSIMGKTGIEFVEDINLKTAKKRMRATIPAYIGFNFLNAFYLSGGLLLSSDGSTLSKGLGAEMGLKMPLLYKNLSLKLSLSNQGHMEYGIFENFNLCFGLGYAF